MDFEAYVSEFALGTADSKLLRRLKFAVMRISEQDRLCLGTIYRGDPDTVCRVAYDKAYRSFSDPIQAASTFIHMTNKGMPVIIWNAISWKKLINLLQTSHILYHVRSTWVLITENFEELKRYDEDANSM